MSSSLRPDGLSPARFFQRDFPGKNTGVGCYLVSAYIN